MMKKIVSIYSSKGGTGKTTLAVSMAAFLADAGIRVLLLDTDEVQSATKHLEFGAPLKCKPPESTDPPDSGIMQVVRMGAILPHCVYPITGVNNLHLVPANVSRNELAPMMMGHTLRYINSLRLALDNVDDAEYDLAIIDTPGAANIVQDAAVIAANEIICPVPSELMAVQELSSDLRFLTDTIAQNPAVRVKKIHAVIWRHRPNISDSRQMVEALRDGVVRYGNIVGMAKTEVPQLKAFVESVTENEPVHRLERVSKTKTPPAFEIIQNLALELFPEFADKIKEAQ